jgi:hypothetical protein
MTENAFALATYNPPRCMTHSVAISARSKFRCRQTERIIWPCLAGGGCCYSRYTRIYRRMRVRKAASAHLLVVALLAVCAICSSAKAKDRGEIRKDRAPGLTGRASVLEEALGGTSLQQVRDTAAAGKAFVGFRPWSMAGGGNVYVLQLEADFEAVRSKFGLLAPQGRRGQEPFDAGQLARRGFVATRAGAEAHRDCDHPASRLTAATNAARRRGGERCGERVCAIGRGGGSARRATRATRHLGTTGTNKATTAVSKL